MAEIIYAFKVCGLGILYASMRALPMSNLSDDVDSHFLLNLSLDLLESTR